MSWEDFDAIARSCGGAEVVQRLRSAERSRRLLLLRSVVDCSKTAGLDTPLGSPEDAWDLLARTEHVAPAALELVLAHPYTGSWAGYVTRVISRRISGVWPLWTHVGYVHALAAAAAIRSGINFRISVPAHHGEVILPTLGLARLPCDDPWAVAEIRCQSGEIEVSSGSATVRLPAGLGTDTSVWWSIRPVVAQAGKHTLSIRLDDVDPYRGPYEPVGTQRLSPAEAAVWRELIAEAWQLIAEGLPDFADALQAGLDSLAPWPFAQFRTPSASSNDAFGSAILGRPADAPTLAAMLVHEFQHNRLSGLLQLVPLWKEDPRERFYVAWRDDPRPIGGVIQGLYAFFGITAFWRALVDSGNRRDAFEFAYHRMVTWQVLETLRQDVAVIGDGQRFLDGIAEVLTPWLDEPVAPEVAEAARMATTDHHLGWRIRHIRPEPAAVEDLATAWIGGRAPVRSGYVNDQPPTPVPDGTWSHARADLVRLVMAASPRESFAAVPDATQADLALVTGRFVDATRGYRAELAEDPDRPASLAGLALALSSTGPSPAARALLDYPELVRAVHRIIREQTAATPSVEELADWIGRTLT